MGDERVTCYKIAFNSATQAERQAKRANRGGRLRGQLRPYRCGTCGLYHLTGEPRRR